MVLDALEESLRLEVRVPDRHGNEIDDPPLAWRVSDSTVLALVEDGTIRSLAPGNATLAILSDTASIMVQ